MADTLASTNLVRMTIARQNIALRLGRYGATAGMAPTVAPPAFNK